MSPRFKVTDRVKPIRGSYLYVIEEILYDEDNGTYVYKVSGLDSPTNIKFFAETDVEFAGFSVK